MALFDTAASIIKSSSSLALQEIELLCGFKYNLKKLGDTVSTIQAVLLDAEEQQADKHAVKDWLRKLKDAMLEADDLLDDFNTELLRRQVTPGNKIEKEIRIFFSESNQIVYGLVMGHRIKQVRERLDAIADDGNNFGFTERLTGPQLEHRKRADSHSFELEDEVIGREDAKETVKKKLLLDSDVNESVSIIPIVGIGGVGKTTLAQYVYNDEEVKKHFEKLRVWVCVSDPFDVKTVVQKIVECAIGKRPKSLEPDLLQRQLRAILNGKRYLLVLDDVWNENRDKWLSLKKLLSGGLKGSKVLITTRTEIVAKITGTVSPYLLGDLSESDSWDLFKRMAFKDGEERQSPKLVEIGREIVKKCARVPLAIRSIGSLLCLKNSEHYWLHFKDSELYKITQQENGIFPILKLSYDHLSPQLKQCFAFCSLYPKDSRIDVKLLIQLWIAQGFIHSSDGNRCLEDVGYECFMDLLWRSFFQDIQRDNEGDIYECKMHDLIHDLAQSVAGEECTNSNPDAEKVVGSTRHVAFDSSISLKEIPAPLLKAHKMRTLLLGIPSEFYGSRMSWNKSFYDTLISSFKCLRALNLSCSNIQEVPNSIGKLKHLRFLDLSSCENIKLLPASITKLQNLQTLRLYCCYDLKELPDDTRNLISLRHLVLDGCFSLTHMPHGLGVLTALQTLTPYTLGKNESSVPKRKGGLDELDSLDELRGVLSIEGLEHLRSFPFEAKAASYLERKEYLRSLELRWAFEAGDDSDKAIANDEQLLENLRPHLNLRSLDIYGYAGVRLSSWVSSLSNLDTLIIKNCKWCQHIPSLDRFPSLKSLSLENLSALEYISNDGSDVSSSSLKWLTLEYLPKLRGWWRMRETVTAEHHHLPLFPSFPCLSSLDVTNCPMMSLIPVVAPGSQTTPPSSSPFSDLSKLKYLTLEGLEELEYLPEELLQNLISLEELIIRECRKLQISMSPLFQHLTALEDLWISNCRELISNEDEEGAQCLGPTTLRRLNIENVPSLVSLPRELRHATALQQLDIENCPSLVSLPEWTVDLTSLEDLNIGRCDKLQISMSPLFQHLTALKDLWISDCRELISNEDEEAAQCVGPTTLRRLYIKNVTSLVSLPRELRHAPTLQWLEIESCPSLVSLPEWIADLTSLQTLQIVHCPNLLSLPEGLCETHYAPLIDIKESILKETKVIALAPDISPSADSQPFLPLFAPSPLTPFTNTTLPKLSGLCT